MIATLFWILLAVCVGFIGLIGHNMWLHGQLTAYRALTARENQASAQPNFGQRLVRWWRVRRQQCCRCCCCGLTRNNAPTEQQEAPSGGAAADPEAPPAPATADQNPSSAPQEPVQPGLDLLATPNVEPPHPEEPAVEIREQPQLPVSCPAQPARPPPPAAYPAGLDQKEKAVEDSMPPMMLMRTNSFRREKDAGSFGATQDQDLKAWMTETARMLHHIQLMTAQKRASNNSLYSTPGSVMGDGDQATGWHYRPAVPSHFHRQPSFRSRELPPIPPAPARVSSLPRKAKAPKQLTTTGERDMPLGFIGKYQLGTYQDEDAF